MRGRGGRDHRLSRSRGVAAEATGAAAKLIQSEKNACFRVGIALSSSQNNVTDGIRARECQARARGQTLAYFFYLDAILGKL
jgi:hypothetical protein